MKLLSIAAVLALLASSALGEENISIETLLKGGWQIVGYASANQPAVESAMILLQHQHVSYLMQCRASYDVTRNPSITVHCYNLR